MIDYDKTSELVLRELRGGKLWKNDVWKHQKSLQTTEDAEKVEEV